jgi:amino-acid N-acetyltransferase
MRLEAATSDADLPRIERLLAENGLPHADLATSPVRLFVGYEGERDAGDGRGPDGDGFVGVGGLEVYGTDALLRSVVVPEEHRGRGRGAALYRAIESRAREEGVERLYLLTATAEDFFSRQGFEVVGREDAPGAIRDTAEFRELCSDAATCMRKAIG